MVHALVASGDGQLHAAPHVQLRLPTLDLGLRLLRQTLVHVTVLHLYMRWSVQLDPVHRCNETVKHRPAAAACCKVSSISHDSIQWTC